ncbi:DUF2971 domain-containing protein [Afipia sp. P52-10]|uniref:DUF2971 domain-containing protein n=1 Tax=Afipia sp. P52-10 TaxID=1429916 RepID=UPI0004AF6130|nr:DUF2971 domain-containing protein [Afipia sp. P52-10]
MRKAILHRYTNLASAIFVLKRRAVTLLSPALWDDRNDAYFMAQYKARKSLKSVLALCFSEVPETYHHWRVFSHGSDGVRIEFDKVKLLAVFKGDTRFMARPVRYREIGQLQADTAPRAEELPFLKRYPYRDEKEFRIVYRCDDEAVETKSFPIPLTAIARITLSPWMPLPLADDVRQLLRTIDGCAGLSVVRSTLLENERWKKLAAPGKAREPS